MTLTIEISPADEPRVREAFGTLAEPATDVTITAAIKNFLGTETQNYERAKAAEAYQSPPLGLMM